MSTTLSRPLTVARWFDGYAAGLAFILPFMPTIAAVVSVVAYLLLPTGPDASTGIGLVAKPTDPLSAVVIGLVVAAVAWLVLAVFAAAFMPADPGVAAPSISAMEARLAAREVHHAIKEFPDDRRDGLIRARNNLLWTMLAVALPAYLLLGLAMLVGVPRMQIVSASTFFLVGAMVGLFQRLDAQAARDR